MADQKPDLNEYINVLESHANLQESSAATSRENQLHENGMEPVSLWVILACFFGVLVAGAVIGKAGGFSYNDLVTKGYTTAPPVGGPPAEAPPQPYLDVMVKKGGKIYSAKCQGCHQPNGLGDGANFPPLGNSEWVNTNSSALAQIILNGVGGPIKVDGRTWNGNMPGQAAGMTSTDLAALMTYIRNSFGNESGDAISIEMADNAFAEYKTRGGGAPIPPAVDVAELQSKYMVDLEGAVIDPQLKVDPETLLPVAE